MYKYKNSSRFTMLLFVNGALREIHPNAIIESTELLVIKYLTLIPEKPKVTLLEELEVKDSKRSRGRPAKTETE